MNKQLSVMGLAARASMVPVLIASGLTALAVGALTYLANPENTGGAAGVGAAPLAAAVGYLMVSVTMFTFTVDVADNAWMAMLLTALALMGWMLELLLTGGKNREE